MAKSGKFSEGIEAMFGGGSSAKQEKPSNSDEPVTLPKRSRGDNLGHGGPSVIKNRYPTSLVVDRVKYEKIRMIALANSLNINEVVDVAFDMCIEAYEKNHGAITSRESRISAREVISTRKRNSQKD